MIYLEIMLLVFIANEQPLAIVGIGDVQLMVLNGFVKNFTK